MRRPSLLAPAVALTLAGCRAPSIPAQPSSSEYTVYNAWLEQASSTLPQPLTFAVDADTLVLNQNELQFQQCLPPRMIGLLDGASPVTLASTSGNEWLKLSDSRPAHLRSPNTPLSFDHPTEWIRVSRVAFTMSGYDAYLWVEHRSCGIHGGGCDQGSGTLVHGKKSSGAWTFEDTVCQVLMPPSAPTT